MNNWFIVKVKYTKQLDNGRFKRVTEPYLLAAMSYTDAEARIYEELGSIIKGEFHITSVMRNDYHDVFAFDDSNEWYVAKVVYERISLDDEKSKKIMQKFLVSAHSVADTEHRLKESLSTLMVEFKVSSVMKSKIVDVFPAIQNEDADDSDETIDEQHDYDVEEAVDEA